MGFVPYKQRVCDMKTYLYFLYLCTLLAIGWVGANAIMNTKEVRVEVEAEHEYLLEYPDSSHVVV